MEQLSEVKERLGVEKTVGKLIDLLGDRIAHRVGDEEVGHPKSEDDPRIGSTCHWASDVVVQILTAEPLSIEAERKVVTIDFSIHGSGAHSYVVFKTEDGERALVHGDDVAADRREVDGEVIAGEFVLTDPGTVEAYWEAVDEKAEELTRDAQQAQTGKKVNSDALESATAWAKSQPYSISYPRLGSDEESSTDGSGGGTNENEEAEPQPASFTLSSSEVLLLLPDSVLVELHGRDQAVLDPKKAKPSKTLLMRQVPDLLDSLPGMGEAQLAALADKVGVPLPVLRARTEADAILSVSRMVERTFSESHGSEAAELVPHPTIKQ